MAIAIEPTARSALPKKMRLVSELNRLMRWRSFDAVIAGPRAKLASTSPPDSGTMTRRDSLGADSFQAITV